MNCDGLGNSLSHEKRNEFLIPRVARQPLFNRQSAAMESFGL